MKLRPKTSRAYAWPTYAALSALTAVHIAAELAQYLGKIGWGGWLASAACVFTAIMVLVLAGILGIDLYEAARKD